MRLSNLMLLDTLLMLTERKVRTTLAIHTRVDRCLSRTSRWPCFTFPCVYVSRTLSCCQSLCGLSSRCGLLSVGSLQVPGISSEHAQALALGHDVVHETE